MPPGRACERCSTLFHTTIKNTNMKRMRYFLPILFALLAVHRSSAQEYKVAVDTKDAKLVLEDFNSDLPIEGYSGNEILVSTTSGKWETPERAKGLKPIYGGGTDNTGIGLFMEKEGNKVTLRCLVPFTKHSAYKLKVPENIALSIHRSCERTGETVIQNIKGEIEFDGCHRIELKNVTGPLVVSTISGGVDVVFTTISKDKPISLATISGAVDVTLPANSPVDVEMSCISGQMYSDFDFPQDKNDLHRIGGNNIHGTLNGGGTRIKLHTISGNIYLRKGK